MISGVTGEEFAAEIFIGPVYYQRLRHMVSDKFQVPNVLRFCGPGFYGFRGRGVPLVQIICSRLHAIHLLVVSGSPPQCAMKQL